ncbi:hypothetical protein K438DRAFT_903972 [Mycena galopus ATCC 62051]|nr:hypothetical protein K438DRAFT_903972 [Mycena galopus ATCC 62051]
MAVYYTWSRGPDHHLSRHVDYQSTRRNALYTTGESILQIYHRLIARLSAAHGPDSDMRLQNAFAAAVWDVSEAQFMAMSDSELAALRGKGTTQMLVAEVAPSLVIYLGGPRQQAIHSSPSTSGRLTFASAEETAAKDDDNRRTKTSMDLRGIRIGTTRRSVAMPMGVAHQGGEREKFAHLPVRCLRGVAEPLERNGNDSRGRSTLPAYGGDALPRAGSLCSNRHSRCSGEHSS